MMSNFKRGMRQTIVSARALLYKAWPNDGKIMRMTGVINDPDSVQYYFSSQHFLKSLRYAGQLAGHHRLLAQSFITDEFLAERGPKLFFSKEPPVVPYRPTETMQRLQDASLSPYLFRFADPDPGRRMYFPVPKSSFAPTVARLQAQLHQERPRLCCIVNRYDWYEQMDLLKQRVRFVRAFVPHIDIYGKSPPEHAPGWTEFATYKGWVQDKQATVRGYYFNLCFENSDFDGYITEKAIEALMAGAVPLYWGGGRYLAETIPADCLIDCRGLEPEAVLERIRTMPFAEIVAYRQAGLEFLQSDAARRFTRDDWAQRILARFREQEDVRI